MYVDRLRRVCQLPAARNETRTRAAFDIDGPAVHPALARAQCMLPHARPGRYTRRPCSRAPHVSSSRTHDPVTTRPSTHNESVAKPVAKLVDEFDGGAAWALALSHLTQHRPPCAYMLRNAQPGVWAARTGHRPADGGWAMPLGALAAAGEYNHAAPRGVCIELTVYR